MDKKLKEIFFKDYLKINITDIHYLNDIRMEFETKRIFEKQLSKKELDILNKIEIVLKNTIDKKYSEKEKIDLNKKLFEYYMENREIIKKKLETSGNN